MTTKTDIANMALSHLGIGKLIGDIDSENSAEANVMRVFFEMCAKSIQSEMEFNFNKRRKKLGLVIEDPNDEYKYCYTYPSECLQFRRIVNLGRNENEDQRWPFKVEDNDAGSGKFIFTDKQNAIGLISVYVDDPTKWDATFALACSYKLAHLCAPRIGGPDGIKMGDRSYQLYVKMRDQSAAHSANEYQPDPMPNTGYMNSRE